MDKLKVKNVVISKQPEESENFEKILEIINEKNINVILVEAGNQINIEKNVYISVLWPKDSNILNKNASNNNALVCKLYYKNFSILFTGDIEEEAEKRILQEYDEKILNSTILKIAHHGSKTSSTEKFINAVNPKIALIGVGKNNKFGHPNVDVLERIRSFGTEIFRTDEDGEITIKVNKKGKVKIRKYIK